MGIFLSLIFSLELVAAGFLMHRLTKCFSAVSIPGLAFVFLLINHGFYMPVIFLKDRIYGPLELDDSLKLRLFAVLSLVYLFFVAGVAASTFLARFQTREMKDYEKKPVVKRKAQYPVILFFFLAIFFFIFYFSRETETLQRFAVYFSSFGQSDLIKELRAAFGSGLSGYGIIGYLWGVSLYFFFPLITLIILAVYFIERSKFYLILSLAAVAMTCLALFSGFHRFPIVHFAVMVMVSIWIFRGRLFYRKKLLFLLLSAAVLFGALLYLFTYDVSLPTAIFYVFNRFTEGANLAWILHLKYFPDYYDFLWGRDIGLLSRVMGWEYVSSPQLIAETFGAHGANFNAMFASGLWVNFGYSGVIIGSFLLGAYLQWLQVWLIRSPRTPTRMALFGYLSLNTWFLSSISVFPALFSFGLATAPIFITGVEIAGGMLRGVLSPKKTQIIKCGQ